MARDRAARVSIVVPLHDHADVVGASLESCLAQDHAEVEVIAVDDCSRDGSLDVARRYEPRVRVVRAPRHVGSCGARNIGLAHARGDFVLFHDSDDLLFPRRLTDDFDALARQPAACVIVSANRWFTSGARGSVDARPIHRRERRLLRRMAAVTGAVPDALACLLRYGGPQHSCVLYRTAFVRALGGFADGTEPYADRELLFRALCQRPTVALNPRVTCGWRVWRSPARMTSVLRGDDFERRLALATRYAATLDRTGWLRHDPVRRALIAHVIGWVYDYAARCGDTPVAAAALRLVARLTRGDAPA